jgi:HPt (histidine-containing phosphotransfer) domain-containing protein
MLIDEAVERPALIRSLIASDVQRAREQAHGLKGAAASVGADQLAAAAAAVEAADRDEIAGAVDRLDAAAVAAILALGTELDIAGAVAS